MADLGATHIFSNLGEMTKVPQTGPIPRSDQIVDFCCGRVKTHCTSQPRSPALPGEPPTCYGIVKGETDFRGKQLIPPRKTRDTQSIRREPQTHGHPPPNWSGGDVEARLPGEVPGHGVCPAVPARTTRPSCLSLWGSTTARAQLPLATTSVPGFQAQLPVTPIIWMLGRRCPSPRTSCQHVSL